jgi:hypothetical protein
MSDTNSFVNIRDLSRRDVLRQIALALTAAGAGVMSPAAAQEVHRHTQEEIKRTGIYTPKFFKPQEYQTITWLAELIVPADGQSGSAVDAGAPEFIDLLCSQNERLGHIYTGGLLWLDARMRQKHSMWFLEASQAQQIELLNELVEAERTLAAKDTSFDPNFTYTQFRDYGVEPRTDLTVGVTFFDWVRKMTVDAYYTSPIGIKDLGYEGTTAVSEYQVPQDILNDALKRSPFGSA